MKKALAISVQTSGWYNPLFGGDSNAREAFTKLKELGFEAIDYNIDTKYGKNDILAGRPSEFYSQDLETILDYYRPIKEILDDVGIEVAQTHAPYPSYMGNVDNPDEFNQHLVEVIGKCIAVCQLLECPAIVVHPYSNSKDLEKQHAVNFKLYRSLIPYGKKYGVKVCLENMPTTSVGAHYARGACSDMNETVWYIDTLNAEAGEDIFGFCLDIGHANLTGNNLYEDILKLGHRLTVLHIHDNDARGDLHLAPYTCKSPGRSNIVHWNGLLRGLRKIGYKGAINFETFAALINTPKVLIPSLLRYIADAGRYFRETILSDEEI